MLVLGGALNVEAVGEQVETRGDELRDSVAEERLVANEAAA